MEAKKTNHMKGSAIKALKFAQGQLVNTNKRYLLHLSADVLGILATGPMQSMLSRDCSDATMIAWASSLYRNRGCSDKIDNLHPHQLDHHLEKTFAAIAQMAACLETHACPGADGEHLAAKNLACAARDFLAMTRAIQSGPGNGKIMHMSQVRPDITARFVAEYLLHFAEYFRGNSHQHYILSMRTKMLNNLEGTGPGVNLSAIPAQKIENLMNLLSKTATLVYKSSDAITSKHKQKELSMSFDSLFTLCANYEWKHNEKRRHATAAAITAQP